MLSYCDTGCLILEIWKVILSIEKMRLPSIQFPVSSFRFSAIINTNSRTKVTNPRISDYYYIRLTLGLPAAGFLSTITGHSYTALILEAVMTSSGTPVE